MTTMKTNTSNDHSDNKITRKEALKKAGKYAAFTAAASMLILSPLKAQGPLTMGGGFGGDPYGGGGGSGSGSGVGKKPETGMFGSGNRAPWETGSAAPAQKSGGLKKSPWEEKK